MEVLNKNQKENELTPEILPEMEKIMSSLANEDAMKIFHVAEKGIISSTETISELKLSQKRYYTRLRELIDSGLIEKHENKYQQTMFGKLCYKLGKIFLDAVKHRDRLDLMDRINKSKTISLEETKEISRAISIGPIGGFTESELISSVRVADTYEKLVSDVIEYVDRAQEKIYFATKYFDARVAEALLRGIKRGVEMVFLSGDTEAVSKRISMMRTLITNPSMIRFFFEFISSKEFKVRCVDLPYTFIVIDGKDAMIEVTKPATGAFSMAFFFSDEKLCERLIETFEGLWSKGSEMTGLIGKSLGEIPKGLVKKMMDALNIKK